MLQQKKPDDYVVATGESHSVREFVECAFKNINIDIEWNGKGVKEKGLNKKTGKVVVEISPEFFRPVEVELLVGDYSKAKKKLGWQPKTKFNELVKIMVEGDVKRAKSN